MNVDLPPASECPACRRLVCRTYPCRELAEMCERIFAKNTERDTRVSQMEWPW